MIPLTPKEVVIRLARYVLGERRVHDYLIKRGIGLRQLGNGYYENSENENCANENSAIENSAFPGKQQLIFMADGKWMHGGLTDRLRGMASAYKFATEHNLDFRIFHTSPFSLQEVLQPNKVDWTIDEKQISRNCSIAKPVLLYREDFNNDSALERQLDDKHKQFHLYSCVDTLGEKFPDYFNELFKPSPLLEEQLRHYDFQLGTGIIIGQFNIFSILPRNPTESVFPIFFILFHLQMIVILVMMNDYFSSIWIHYLHRIPNTISIR